MFWVSLGYGFTPLTQAIENRLLSFGRTKSLILPQIFGAVGLLSLTFLLVPRYGALGVAYARGAVSALQLGATSVAWLHASAERRMDKLDGETAAKARDGRGEAGRGAIARPHLAAQTAEPGGPHPE